MSCTDPNLFKNIILQITRRRFQDGSFVTERVCMQKAYIVSECGGLLMYTTEEHRVLG